MKSFAAVTLALAAVLGVACVDMSAPKGPAAISLLQLPALYIVRGDVMRDTNGTPAAPSLIQFDASGTPSPATTAQFFTTDSAPIATFNSSGQLVAKDTTGLVHVIGQIGKVQTPSLAVAVTSAPDSLVTTLTPVNDTLKVPFSADSAGGSGNFLVTVQVKGVDQVPVQGVFVNFELAAHSTRQKYPAVFLTNENNTFANIDTTDAGGNATIHLNAVAIALDSTVLAGGPDSAVVTASAKYKGAPLKNSPLTMVIPIRVTFP